MPQDNKYIRLLKNTAIVLFGSASSKLLVYLLIPFYTKFLTPTEYGISDLVITYATMLLGLVTCQIQDAIFVFPKGASKDVQSAFFSSGLFFLFLSYLSCSLIFVLLYFFLSHEYFFLHYLWIIAGYLFLEGVQLFFQQFCRSIDRMVFYAMSGIACSIGTLVSALILIPYFKTGISLIFSRYIGLLCGIITPLIGAKIYQYWVWKWSFRDHFKPLLLFSIPMIPTAIMWWAISSLNKIFISEYLGLEDVGIFSLAFRITSILFYMWNILGNAWQISVLEEFNKKDFPSYFSKMLDQFIYLHLLIYTAMSVFSPLYMKYFVSKDFYQAYYYIPILAFSAVFSNAAGFFGTVFTASKQTKYFLYSSIASLIVIVPANVISIKLWSLTGAAIGVFITILSQLITRLYFSQKFVQISGISTKVLMIFTGVLILFGFYCHAHFVLQMLLYLSAGILLMIFTVKDFNLYYVAINSALHYRKNKIHNE